MGWQIKGPPKTVKVTNELAKKWADMPAAHVDRPVSERRLIAYRRMAQEGGFRPITWAKVYCKEIDDTFRVNGKHTSTVFSTLDLSKLPAEIYATIEDYECDTIEDVAQLYSTFDSQLQTRNSSDINRAFAATIPELKDHGVAFINLMVGGIAYATWPSGTGGNSGQTAAERAELLFDNVTFCLWCHGILDAMTKATRHLQRVPVVAAMFMTYQRAKQASTDFWSAVRDATGTTPDTPDRKLEKFLSTTRALGGRSTGSIPTRYRITPREYLVKCLRAWNAWRKKETTNLNYSPEHKIPAAM